MIDDTVIVHPHRCGWECVIEWLFAFGPLIVFGSIAIAMIVAAVKGWRVPCI